MPELPEVETMRRGVRCVRGSRIVAARRVPCRRRPIAIEPRGAALGRRLVGRTIEKVDRVGKRVVLRIEGGDALVFEPRMTGLVLVADPPTRAHLRFRLELEGRPCPELLFWDRRGLGSVKLLSPAEQREALGPPRLGPDALQVSAERLQAALGGSRRAIKVALLDQRAVAGIGNLYAAEILHVARIHPERPCDRLRAPQWERLAEAIDEVLRAAIRYEGSTLSDGTYRNALNEEGGYQNHHRVYMRVGEPCLTCERGKIRRIVQAQRSTFYCPRCQPAGRVARKPR